MQRSSDILYLKNDLEIEYADLLLSKIFNSKITFFYIFKAKKILKMYLYLNMSL